MNAKNMWAAFVRSPTRVKLLTFMVILIWLIPFIAIIAGLIFFLEKPGVALEATPSGITPVITLEPASGPVGTTVTVQGEGWPAGQMVLIRLMAPTETEIPTYAAANAVTDQAGHFRAEFDFPAETRWEGQSSVLIIAQADEGGLTAGATFTLLGQVSPPQEWPAVTEEPTVTPEPTATLEVIATEEPTATIEPSPTPTLVVQPPTATPQPAQPLAIAITDLNIRSGPGMAYSTIGLLRAGQTAEVTGLSPDGGWWQIKFSGAADGHGWVSAKYVTAQNVSNIPLVQAPPLPAVPTATPTPLPTPPPVITDWRGDYFNNRDLAGAPVLVRNDVTVDFNWGAGSPAAGIPVDNFSVRWTRWWSSSEGTHRFHVSVDDGVRLYVDEALVIDSWQDGSWREVVGERWLGGGNHSLRIEYYEHIGDAAIKAWAEKVSTSTAPDADFDAEHRSGNVPLHVEFDNDSDGDYDRCEWDFGDDHDSDDCDDPHHTYKEAGEYTVRLKIWGPGGSDSKKREDFVTVRPMAQFDASPKSGPKPLTVSFVNQSTSHDLSEWDFGDGQTSTQHNPTHTYTAAGVYTVRLRVKEEGVWSDYQTKLNFITVTELPPVAAFTATPTSGPSPLNVQFTDQSSGVITAWLWDFGDGAPGSALQSPTHTYATAGVYNVSLTVSGPGGSDIEAKTGFITVTPPPPPVANFSAMPTSGPAPLEVQFTDQSGGAYDTCLWDFGDGTTSTLENPTHIYAAGVYTVTLTVNGPGGSDTETKPNYITVSPEPPEAKFIATPTIGIAPLTVTFTDHSLGTITDWLWSFGDGAGSTEQNPTHIYAASGEYTVSLTVSGPAGSNTATRPSYIVVTEQMPIVKFRAEPTTGPAPLTVNFIDDSLPKGSITAWQWSFGDGASSTEPNPTHIYTEAGNYTVSLTVSDSDGRSDTLTRSDLIRVTEANQPPQMTNPGSQNNTEGDTVSLPIVASDPDGDTLSYSATNLPPGLSINADTGLISGILTDEAADNSPYAVTVTLSDGIASVDIGFEWAVSALEPNRVPEPPTPTPEPPTPTPIPPTPTPEPPTPTPEPPTVTPEPPTFTPEPPTPTPEPPTFTPEPPTPTPEPPTPTPEPPTPTPEPPTPTPEPPIPTPEPPTPTPEPPTPTPVPPPPEPPTPVPPTSTPVPPNPEPVPPSTTPEFPTLTPTSEPLSVEANDW